MEHTTHTLLVGELATQFAKQMGFQEESLTGEHSKTQFINWKNKANCQPNYWKVMLNITVHHQNLSTDS